MKPFSAIVANGLAFYSDSSIYPQRQQRNFDTVFNNQEHAFSGGVVSISTGGNGCQGTTGR